MTCGCRVTILVRALATLVTCSLEDSGGMHGVCVGGLVCVPRNGECDSGALCVPDLPGRAVATGHPWGRDWVRLGHCFVARA